jgi:hypothetical protein
MHESLGTLRYGPGIRIVVEIDRGIVDFYISLIPKYYNVKPQKYMPHITVIRTGKETPVNMQFWGNYEGQNIKFYYDNNIQTDGTYFWLNVQSDDIAKIRKELGLPHYRDDRNFGGNLHKEYHITIANIKDQLLF